MGRACGSRTARVRRKCSRRGFGRGGGYKRVRVGRRSDGNVIVVAKELMTLTITLPQEAEARLRERAAAVGQDPARYAERLLAEELAGSALSGARSTAKSSSATLELLAQWEREDHTNDPAELARRQREGEELMENLERNRREMEGGEARKLWP